MTATESLASPESWADVLDALGVPAHRVMAVSHPASEADVVRLADGEPKRMVELVDGYLVEKTMGLREAVLALAIGAVLREFVRRRRLGVVAGADAMFRLFPGMVRLPDVCFIARDGAPAPDAHLQRVGNFAPALAVEVVSEGNTAAEITRKRREYMTAGTRLVWVVYPDTETVEVFADRARPDMMTLFRAADTLDGGGVLPGFRLPLAEVFADLEPFE